MDQSPLSRLPQEIRNHIYEFALPASKPWTIHVSTAGRGPLNVVTKKHRRDELLALFKTCRAFYLESSPLFYAASSFIFRRTSNHTTFGAFARFKETVGPRNANALRYVKLDLDIVYISHWTDMGSNRFQDCLYLAKNVAPSMPRCSLVLAADLSHNHFSDLIPVSLDTGNLHQSWSALHNLLNEYAKAQSDRRSLARVQSRFRAVQIESEKPGPPGPRRSVRIKEAAQHRDESGAEVLVRSKYTVYRRLGGQAEPEMTFASDAEFRDNDPSKIEEEYEGRWLVSSRS